MGTSFKRIGEKGSYTRKLLGFLRDCGLGILQTYKAPKEAV